MPDMKDALFQVSNREESCKKLGSESGVLEVSLRDEPFDFCGGVWDKMCG